MQVQKCNDLGRPGQPPILGLRFRVTFGGSANLGHGVGGASGLGGLGCRQAKGAQRPTRRGAVERSRYAAVGC